MSKKSFGKFILKVPLRKKQSEIGHFFNKPDKLSQKIVEF